MIGKCWRVDRSYSCVTSSPDAPLYIQEMQLLPVNLFWTCYCSPSECTLVASGCYLFCLKFSCFFRDTATKILHCIVTFSAGLFLWSYTCHTACDTLEHILSIFFLYFGETVATMIKHLVMHLNIFSVIISDIIRRFGLRGTLEEVVSM